MPNTREEEFIDSVKEDLATVATLEKDGNKHSSTWFGWMTWTLELADHCERLLALLEEKENE